MITLPMITREMVMIIGSQLSLEFRERVTVPTTQTYVDFFLEATELNKPLDDLSEKRLLPAANKLIERLNVGNALCCYQLPEPKAPYDWARVQYNGCSIRGIVDRTHQIFTEDGSTKTVNLFRFDILWS